MNKIHFVAETISDTEFSIRPCNSHWKVPITLKVASPVLKRDFKLESNQINFCAVHFWPCRPCNIFGGKFFQIYAATILHCKSHWKLQVWRFSWINETSNFGEQVINNKNYQSRKSFLTQNLQYFSRDKEVLTPHHFISTQARNLKAPVIEIFSKGNLIQFI